MIDLHAHILPGLDDGPATLEEAVAMARDAAAAGTRAIATTSHVNHGFGLAIDEIEAARERLQVGLAAERIALELLAGGEIAPSRLDELADDDLRRIALGGGPYVLLECPFSPIGAALELMVEDLQRRGFKVLLAHPERSPAFIKQPERLKVLAGRGVLAQVTTGSLTGRFGSTVRRAAATMVEQGLVHVLASDAHDARDRSPGLAGVLDEPLHDWMTTAVPGAIVTGEPVPERPSVPRRRRLRAWSGR